MYLLCSRDRPESFARTLDEYLKEITLWDHSSHSAPTLYDRGWVVTFDHPRDTQYTTTWENIHDLIRDFTAGHDAALFLQKRDSLSRAIEAGRGKRVWDPIPLLNEFPAHSITSSWRAICEMMRSLTGNKFKFQHAPKALTGQETDKFLWEGANLYVAFYGSAGDPTAHVSCLMGCLLGAVAKFSETSGIRGGHRHAEVALNKDISRFAYQMQRTLDYGLSLADARRREREHELDAEERW